MAYRCGPPFGVPLLLRFQVTYLRHVRTVSTAAGGRCNLGFMINLQCSLRKTAVGSAKYELHCLPRHVVRCRCTEAVWRAAACAGTAAWRCSDEPGALQTGWRSLQAENAADDCAANTR